MTKNEVRSNILKAFAYLRRKGIIARANFLCCQTCAGYDITQIAVKRVNAGKEVKGCVFWHAQDEQNWQRSGSMFLAFGNMDSGDLGGNIGLETTLVGKIVVEALKKFNVPYEWDGSSGRRIKVMEKEQLKLIKIS
jgi:hypothetical protein